MTPIKCQTKLVLILLILLMGFGSLSAILGLRGERYAISGIEYYHRGEYRSAISEFLAADRAAESKVPTYHFWLGRLYIALGDIDNATIWINKYLESGDQEFQTEANDYLRIVNRQVRIFEKVGMRDLPNYISTRNSDYGAVVTPDGKYLYYTSLSPARKEKENIWRSERLATGWGRPYLVDELNTDKNEAVGSFSKDGQTVYLFGNYKKGQLDGDIFAAQWTGTKWGTPIAIDQVNSPQVEAHPFVYDDKYMFFSSSRDGGFGGFDIYVSELKNGAWGEPINLGSKINTSGNEQTPFLDYDGRTLFFASNHHPGFGGYDLFKAVRSGDTWEDWSIPENLGLPINSIRNDRFFFHLPKSNDAFIATDRRADGFEKIKGLTLVFAEVPSYLVVDEESKEEVVVLITEEGDFEEGTEPESVIPIEPLKFTTVSGKLIDEKGKPIVGEIEFFGFVDGQTHREIVTTDENGNYTVKLPRADKYNVIVNKEGYLLHAEEIVLNDAETFALNIKLKKLALDKVFAFQNILFNFDSAVLREESYAVLDEIVVTLLTNENLKLNISGHTCDIGRAEYNLNLSKRRANSVYDYIVSKGVDPERLSHTGYGEERPLNKNLNLDERKENRRVEFKVVK